MAQMANPVPNCPEPSSSSDNEKGDDTDHSHLGCQSPTATPPPFEFDDPKGWIAVVAAACSLFVYLGVVYSWGIMQVRLVEVTGTSLTTLTFVGSLATSFMISLSILSGMAVRKLGYQKTAFAGGLLMGLGEFLASWTTKHVGALFVFHGVIFGIGGGLSIFVSPFSPRCFEFAAHTSTGLLYRPFALVQETPRPGHGHCVWRRKSWCRYHEHSNQSPCEASRYGMDVPHSCLYALGSLYTSILFHPTTYGIYERRTKVTMVSS